MNPLVKPAWWILLFLTACGFPKPLQAQAPAAQTAECKGHPSHLHANLWMQTSAEYQAICRQTFNAALKEVKQVVKSARRHRGRPAGPGKKPLAVVADLDETLVDNARFQSEMDAAAWLDCNDAGFTPKRWRQWERENPEEVALVPGAGAFISEVEKQKVVMVYLSNRLESLKESTIRALAHNGVNTEGLQDASQRRLLLRREASSKQARIQQAEEKYHVIAYLGDNLNDFPGETEQPGAAAEHTAAARRNKVESAAELWGTRWFMLPNPVYGSWDQILPKPVQERMQLLKRANRPAFVKAN
jgi:5'-nucleotidase (lipoprotein e(P4) family)